MKKFLLAILFCLVGYVNSNAQGIYRFRLTTGEIVSGEKVSENDSSFLILTHSPDTVMILKKQVIDHWKSLSSVIEEQIIEPAQARTSVARGESPYFLHEENINNEYRNRVAAKYAATGHYRPLKQGLSIYENNMVLFNQLLISPGEYVNLGLGGTLSFGFELAYWITPRATIPINDFISLGFGTTILGYRELFDEELGNNQRFEATYFGGATFGSAYNHVTINLSRGYNNFIVPIESILFRQDEFIFQANGIYRVADRLSIMAETVFFNEEFILIPALKSHFKKCEFNYGFVLNSYFSFLYLGIQVYLFEPNY